MAMLFASRFSIAHRAATFRPLVLAQSRAMSSIFYSKEHEWIRYDSATQTGRVGISEHAAQALGDIVFVELPGVGDTVQAGDTCGAAESVKAASDVYSPVTGEVVEVNEQLTDEPGLINESAEDQGWIMNVKLSDPTEVDALMTPEAYAEFCKEEDA